MKRCVATLLSLGFAGLVLAQAPFTIVRPADGSKVREKVHFLIPKNSVPDGGYIGVFTTTTDASGGQKRRFIEGVIPRVPSKNPDYEDYVPDKNSKFVEYVMDTKAMSIPDGAVNVELVLYVQYGEQPRVVDRSSVDLTVANSASIKIPEDGIKLRYKFIPGIEYVYDVEQRVSVQTLTEAQNQMGEKPGDLPLDAERLRVLYAIDNVYPNGDALIRCQTLPSKGKDYAYLIPSQRSTWTTRWLRSTAGSVGPAWKSSAASRSTGRLAGSPASGILWTFIWSRHGRRSPIRRESRARTGNRASRRIL